MNPNKVGLVIGALIGGWESGWVASCPYRLGATNPEFHFLGAHDQAGLFRATIRPIAAVVLILITSVIGYGFGFFGAVIWKRLHRR